MKRGAPGDKRRPLLTLRLPLDGPTAAALLDLCCQMQAALWRAYGTDIEDHWTATEPSQLIYGPLRPPPKR